jgi:signal transduction histidine kinase/CheY-like chemotaxis protein
LPEENVLPEHGLSHESTFSPTHLWSISVPNVFQYEQDQNMQLHTPQRFASGLTDLPAALGLEGRRAPLNRASRAERPLQPASDGHDEDPAHGGFRQQTASNTTLSSVKPEGQNDARTSLAILAHELRNPLACVSHATHVLRAAGNQRESAAHDWAVSTIERNTRRLVSIVSDALGDPSKPCCDPHWEPEVIDAVTVIERAKESVRSLMEMRRHAVSSDVPSDSLWLSVHAGRLEQILVNLLTNAARYTDDGGRISITAGREGRNVAIRVTDNGIGIAPENLTSLFELYYRTESARGRVAEGLGIGLAVVRSLVRLLGGYVTVASEGLGRGSTFAIHLPAASLPSSEAYSGPRMRAAFARILIIDDHVELASGLERLLTLRGYTVRCASTGVTALRVAKDFQPDFAFVDICLPDLNGYEVAALLPGIIVGTAKIVTTSGYGRESDNCLSKATGAVAHLEKPVSLEDILAILTG